MEKTKLQQLETNLWNVAVLLRGHLSAEDYMHVVIGIIVLKYINDKYDNAVKKINEKMNCDINEMTVEEIKKDGYDEELKVYGAIIVPNESKWKNIMKKVGTSEIGDAIDTALYKLEEENEDLEDVFNTQYKTLDVNKLSEIMSLFDKIDIDENCDLLGQIYEFFLGKFFLDRGQKGGEFYTPKCIVFLITSILNIETNNKKVYDPACGSGGMLIAANKYVKKFDEKNRISVYGQELNKTTRKLAILNLFLNNLPIKSKTIDGNTIKRLGESEGDTFTNDQHKNSRFDYVMANPPFNLKSWYNETLNEDSRFSYGLPPKTNANYAWIQHILSKLNQNGKAGVVLANGSLTSTTGGEDKIRKAIIQDNKVSCIISLPDKLFYTTSIPACIWFFDNNKKNDKVLFIDAQDLGTLLPGSKKNKEINDDNLEKIVNIYRDFEKGENINIPGLARTVELTEIENNEYSLLPGRYIEIKENDKKDQELIKKELMNDINNLIKLIDESKKLENELLDAINLIKSKNFSD